MTDDLMRLSLAGASAALARGDFSATELLEACRTQVERLNPELNFALSCDWDGAFASAKESDARRARGDVRGPLDGIPLAHKDIFDRAGRRTTAGSIILDDRVPDVTATVLERLDEAGAIEIGHLNLSEFAAGATGHNRHHGDCRNPWDLDRISGGSSSGSAAAVAARAVFGSLGTDTGGSGRLPAHFCGVTGLRPTYGRVSRAGVVARSWSADAVAPLARTAEDVALLLQAIAVADPRDMTAAAVEAADYRHALDDGATFRLGVPRNHFFDRLDPSIAALIDDAIRLFEQIGCATRPVTVPDPAESFAHAEVILKAEAAALHRQWLTTRIGDYDHGIAEQMVSGLDIPATFYIQALRQRPAALEEFVGTVFGDADLLITPVYEHPTPTLAECDPADPAKSAEIMATFGRCTRPFSYLGLPAIAVPCGFQSDGMPAAFQLVARPFDEALLLAAAHRYQRETGWHEAAPPTA